MSISYKKFDEKFIEEKHGRLYFYRKLYQGKHSEVFERAAKLIDEGEIIDNLLNKSPETMYNKTPYIVANIVKLIIDVPAMLVSRSIGKIDSSLSQDDLQTQQVNQETDDAIAGPDDNTVNGTILDVQRELIKQIVEDSKLTQKHWGNVMMQQLDGGLVGVPWEDDRGIRLEFKGRDVYFPHEDELGADLSYTCEIKGIKYLRIYRERIMKQGDIELIMENEEEQMEDFRFTAPADGVYAKHILMKMGKGGAMQDKPLTSEETAELLGMELDDVSEFYPGRTREFIRYWGNEVSILNPLGMSAITGQENTQDEINWALTRNALVFERNGKPRIAVNKELAHAMQKNMIAIYGDKAKGKIDSKMLEIVTMDAQGNSMEIFQIDITKIGDVQWVKDLVKIMLMETRTSEKAIDFYMDAGGGAAQSGVAKFYDLFMSLMKAEALQAEYIEFIQGLIEDALWLANRNDPAVRIEKPEIQIADMIPIERKELIDQNITASGNKAIQSLETSIRRANPYASEEWLQEEIARVMAEKASDDSSSLMTGRQTFAEFMDNPGTRPTPGQEEEEANAQAVADNGGADE